MDDPAKRLSASAGLDLDRFQTFLRTRCFARMLRYSPSTASTNADALAYLQQHAGPTSPHGLAILADRQTAGRGRRGRSWHSPAEGNIYSSVILVPEAGTQSPGQWLSWVPLFSALAAADCLSSHTGLAVSVKWPNDLLIGDKKLGGILCEQTSTSDKAVAVVIGIGLNINAAVVGFPEELKTRAISLAMACGRTLDREAILADLFFRLEQRMERLCLDGPAGMIDEFRRRCSTLGQTVRVMSEQRGLVEGLAESIGLDGCHCVRVASDAVLGQAGSLLEMRSAEVVHLRG